MVVVVVMVLRQVHVGHRDSNLLANGVGDLRGQDGLAHLVEHGLAQIVRLASIVQRSLC